MCYRFPTGSAQERHTEIARDEVLANQDEYTEWLKAECMYKPVIDPINLPYRYSNGIEQLETYELNYLGLTSCREQREKALDLLVERYLAAKSSVIDERASQLAREEAEEPGEYSWC
jgi:hypothetical protein